MTNSPKVSIGLPVYNGAVYLQQTLDSLLAQTYTDFELIISDNGSVDGTEQICRTYAARDSRIHYHRYENNRGAAWNYNNVFHLAKGAYFKWAAADDLCAPQLLEKCVALLDANPLVVLSFPEVIDIDGNGREMQRKSSAIAFDKKTPSQRFRSISRVSPTRKCEEIFGVVRTHILAQTPLILSYSDSDRTLLAELSLHGPFGEVPEPLFIHRIHENNSVHGVERQERTVWFDTSAAGKIVFPNWRQFGELFRSIGRGPIGLGEQLRCYVSLISWAKQRRKWLVRDIVWALNQTFPATQALSFRRNTR